MRLAVFVPALVFCVHTASAQLVRVAQDARAETIGIMFRLAGAPDFSNGV